MLVFGLISALGAAALFLVQRLDIECANPPRTARNQPVRTPAATPARALPTYSA